MKWIGLAAVILLAVSCFTPWVFIASKNITVSGVEATGTNFGKPGYFHFILAAVFLVGNFVQKVWAKRMNLIVAALNMGWALKNFLMLTACPGGDCPEKKAGIWLSLLASVIMLAAALFPDIKLPPEKNSRRH